MLESLAAAGAFDELEANRARAFASVDTILGVGAARARVRRWWASPNCSAVRRRATPLVLPSAEPWPPAERLQKEFDAIGFFLSGHPLDDYAPALKRMRVQSWAEFARSVKAGASAGRVAGSVVSRQERRTRTGSKMGIIGLSDPSGHYEAVLFSEGLAQYRDQLEPGKAVLLGAVGGAAGRRRARAHPDRRVARRGGGETAEGPARVPARREAAGERRQAAAGTGAAARRAATKATARSRWC